MSIPLEATVTVRHKEGSRDFHGRFYAHMEYMGEDEVLLLDSKDSKVTIMSDGCILLSRRVVLVEERDELTLGVKAWPTCRDGNKDAVEGRATFHAKIHSRSDGSFDLGFCKMDISVAWSVLV
uniref:DUF6598 domain-containing protein n=1 Tax=Arundo donax TaxID=35708 RepID=A0A0A8YIJ1_ARUDO